MEDRIFNTRREKLGERLFVRVDAKTKEAMQLLGLTGPRFAAWFRRELARALRKATRRKRSEGKPRRAGRLQMRPCLGHDCKNQIHARYPGLCNKCKRHVDVKESEAAG